MTTPKFTLHAMFATIVTFVATISASDTFQEPAQTCQAHEESRHQRALLQSSPRLVAGVGGALGEEHAAELRSTLVGQRNGSMGLAFVGGESTKGASPLAVGNASASSTTLLNGSGDESLLEGDDDDVTDQSLPQEEEKTRRMSLLQDLSTAPAPSNNWFTSGELGQETCGTRPVFPQLQFELEVYRKLGLVEAHYARCHVPSIRKVVLYLPFGYSITRMSDSWYSWLDRLMEKRNWHFLKDRRILVAKVFAGAFCVLAIMLIGFYAVTMFPLDADDKASDALLIEASWKSGSRRWLGLDFSWLEPVISRFGWASSPQMKLGELEMNAEEDLEDYLLFRRIWQEEVKKKGAAGEQADLLRAVRRFVGNQALAWMLFTASMAAILELVALTAVFDLLLNYLHLAQTARQTDVLVALDPLRPTLMFICLGFGVPIAALAFRNAAAFCDAYHANRITSVLLTMIYEKSQHLPYFESSEDQRKDVGHMIMIMTHDIRRMWAGALTSFTNLVIYPTCALFLVVFLAGQLGRAAAYGFLSTVWMGFLYFPIKNNMARGQMRWGQLANSRLELMKDAIVNVRTIKATCWDIPLSECVYTLRDDELHARFRFSTVASLLDVPLNVFPFALVMSSLFFTYVLYGVVQPQDIFVCMQTLSGLICCFPSIVAALQNTVSMPSILQRIRRFLHEPEKPAGVVRKPPKEPGSPYVRVRGDFLAGQGQRPILRDMDLQVQRGELVAVIGEVASGKSALLSAIMGELQAGRGSTVEASKTPIFCSQEPWVVDGSLRENVILDAKENEDRFYDVLEASSLLKDLTVKEPLPKPDEGAKQPVDKSKIFLKEKEWKQKFKFPYFYSWNLCAIFVFSFAVYNVDWKQTRPSIGILIAAIQGLLHWSVLEFPLQTIATLLTKGAKLAKAHADHCTICLNYNLLATSQADIDECMTNMMEGYLFNLAENVASALVSATNDPDLMQYELQMRNDQRAQIYKQVYHDGLCWAGFVEGGESNPAYKEKIWKKYEHVSKTEFVQKYLQPICEKFAKDYMICHRTTRVLRKCGQYQDLILLSMGYDKSYTYCSSYYYGKAARKADAYLFHPSEDTDNVKGRHFDYTLVLDSDTRVEPLSVFAMLEVAAAYPEKAIVQPAIKMDCGPEDSIFMHLDAMRQRVFEPMNITMTTLLGKSSFFGKGLIKNSAYAKYCLGTHDRLIESVPINVLSHDTFEAAVLNPLYCNCVFLLEAPCHNYITWDIRERRWNLGEMLLAGYFWPDSFGWLTEKAQRYFQGAKYNKVHVRTVTKLDKVSSYFAHSALRQMCLKPMLLLYIVVMHFSVMKWKWTPLAAVMFAIVVFPKFCTLNRNNWVDVMLETGASILQFTPEGIVGTIRVLSAVKAHIVGAATWIPQRAVEEESRTANPFVFATKFLWYYSAFALIWGMRIALYSDAVGPEALFILTILGTLFMLPVYVGFTSLQANCVEQLLGKKKKTIVVKPEAEEDEFVFGQDWEDDTTELQAFRMRLPKMKLKTQSGGARRAEFVKKAWSAAETQVGVHGIPLSKADRAQLALARAAYSKRSNLVLVDDPFANVDTATGLHLFEKVIRGPMMKDRTRIVAMQPCMEYLEHFDKVVLMSEGRIVVQGSPKDVTATPEFKDVMDKRAKDSDMEEQVVSNGVLYETGESPLKLSCQGAEPLREEETQGFPRWTVIADAIAAGGPVKLALAWGSVTLLRISIQGQMILLGRWADQAQQAQEYDIGGSYYLAMTALVLIFSLCQVLQNYSIQAFSSRVSSVFFRRAFAAVMRAPVEGFWNKQPAGRVLARLTSDALTVDTTLARSFVTLATVIVDVMIQQAYCFMVMPIWLMIPTYIVIVIFFRFFCNTAMRLQMLAALALSQCQEMQVGSKSSLLSIHAFHYQNQLVGKYCNQTKLVVMPDSLCNYTKSWAVSRITFCLCFQCTVCVLNGIFRPQAVSVAALTMIITSTLFIVHQLTGFSGTLMDSASLGISLQRLAEYNTVQQEPPERLAGDDDKRHMMMVKDGVNVTIEGLCARYGGAGQDVLRGISMNIMPRTKVVFAGAPGSGKSTALHCILRIVEPNAGCILLNDIDIKNMGLLTLRSMIGLVPQDPTIFRGTVRFNVDPFGQYPEERIWAAIQCAQLLPTVRRYDRGLDFVFSDEGSNLSCGQKQLVSLARVVCKQPALVLLDECGSSVDPRTRAAVHDTITLNFPNSTVIAATRRLDEISNFQHAVIFDKGQAVREGPVRELLTGSL